MNRERKRRVEDLFHKVADLAPDARERLLDEQCAGDSALRREVESLLAHSDAPYDPLAGPFENLAPSDDRSGVSGNLPKRLGQYEITRRIGAGGMGEVYEAQQQNPQRTVALKVLRGAAYSSHLLKRFEYEAQALGRLQHSGIAQIIEAGTFDSPTGRQPFFAMEFVKGAPLNKYAERRALTLRERVELMSRICDAIHHAHQQGVIHRDLKPANILVTDAGEPKVLDFGVARMTESDVRGATIHTNVGQLIGTIAYMSPEQAAGDPAQLDTRSDVYTLGVVLYELLARRLPYAVSEKPVHEAARIIREDNPTPVSAVDRAIRGDIETIILKALEKDKSRRYQSANELAGDIRRYLSDEPVTARPPSAIYHLKKFAVRHKAWVLALAAVFAVAVTGFLVSTLMYFRAENARQREIVQRQKSEREAHKTVAINAFLVDMLAQANPSLNPDSRAMTVQEALDAAAAEIETAFPDEPEIHAAIRLTIGAAYRELGQYDESISHLESALRIRRALHGDYDESIGEALMELGPVLRRKGDYDRAETIFREALSIQEERFGKKHANTATALGNLGNLLQFRGRHNEAEALLREAVRTTRTAAPDDHLGLGIQLDNLARTLHSKGTFAEADAVFREALACKRRGYGGDHVQIAISLNNLASLHKEEGNTGEAIALFEKSHTMMRRVLGDRHPHVAIVQSNLADALSINGRAADALPLARGAVEIAEGEFGRQHWRYVDMRLTLANALYRHGKFAEARPIHQDLLKIVNAEFGNDHSRMADLKSNMAKLARDTGDLSQAERLARESAVIFESRAGICHPRTLRESALLASILRLLGKHDDALAVLTDKLKMVRASPPDKALSFACLLRELAEIRLAQGDVGGATEAANENHKIVIASLPVNHWLIADAESLLGACLYAAGNHDDAQPLLVAGARGLARHWGSDHARTRESVARINAIRHGESRQPVAATPD